MLTAKTDKQTLLKVMSFPLYTGVVDPPSGNRLKSTSFSVFNRREHYSASDFSFRGQRH
jgi:hypothetical protein